VFELTRYLKGSSRGGGLRREVSKKYLKKNWEREELKILEKERTGEDRREPEEKIE